MDVKKAILKRTATRQYLDWALSDRQIKRIIQVAQKAPSWINAQESRLYVAKGQVLDRMRKVHRSINDDPNLHTKSDVAYSPIRDWDLQSQKNMKAKINFNFKKFGAHANQMINQHKDNLFNAPAVVYLTLPAHYAQYSLVDVGLLAQTIMLSAYDQGISSLPAFEFVKYPDHVRKFLRIPSSRKLILGIGLGYRDPNDPINQINPKRMPTDKMLKIIKK